MSSASYYDAIIIGIVAKLLNLTGSTVSRNLRTPMSIATADMFRISVWGIVMISLAAYLIEIIVVFMIHTSGNDPNTISGFM